MCAGYDHTLSSWHFIFVNFQLPHRILTCMCVYAFWMCILQIKNNILQHFQGFPSLSLSPSLLPSLPQITQSMLMPSVDFRDSESVEFQVNFVMSGGMKLILSFLTEKRALPNAGTVLKRYIIHIYIYIYMYCTVLHIYKALTYYVLVHAEQLGIHGADEGQPAQNSCLPFAWFALCTPFPMYILCMCTLFLFVCLYMTDQLWWLSWRYWDCYWQPHPMAA